MVKIAKFMAWIIQEVICADYLLMGLAVIVMVPALCAGNYLLIIPVAAILYVFYATYKMAVRMEKEEEIYGKQ